jgi:DNA-binding Lrp family transcriptional regulator
MPDASRPVGDLTDDQIRKRLRVPVQEAAHLLGISPEAVRSRLYRGTLDKETGTDGTVYVRLHADQLRHVDEQTADQSQPNAELVGELRARVEDLREQLSEEREARRRADTIIAQLARANEEQARTIRELEAPSEPPTDDREAPETVEEEPERAEAHPAAGGAQEATQRRSWWRRMFGG